MAGEAAACEGCDAPRAASSGRAALPLPPQAAAGMQAADACLQTPAGFRIHTLLEEAENERMHVRRGCWWPPGPGVACGGDMPPRWACWQGM